MNTTSLISGEPKIQKKHQYTWGFNTKLRKSRLDYQFVSRTLLSKTLNSKIKHSILTDHRLVTSTIIGDQVDHPKEKLWRFNTELLDDVEFVENTKMIIAKGINKYRESKPTVIWDTIKMEIRQEAIRITLFNSKQRKHARRSTLRHWKMSP